MQVYRGMDIGTAKPTVAEQQTVRHHLIDVLEPHEDYTVSQFAVDAQAAATDIVARGGIPVLVGGTGLYIRAVVDDFEIPGQYPEARAQVDAEPDTSVLFAQIQQLDPLAASRMEPTNRRRIVRALEVTLGSDRRFSDWGPGMEQYPTIPTRQIACDRPRPTLDERINARYGVQMDLGFLDEVQRLAAAPHGLSRTARQALGYKELLQHIEDGEPLDDVLDLAKQRTRRFARRQQRWFRRDPRIEWLDLDVVDQSAVVADLARGLIAH